MKRNNAIPKPEQPPAVPPRDRGAEFVAEYEKLCTAYGIQFTAVPTFRPRDDGTFSIVIQWQLGAFQKKP